MIHTDNIYPLAVHIEWDCGSYAIRDKRTCSYLLKCLKRAQRSFPNLLCLSETKCTLITIINTGSYIQTYMLINSKSSCHLIEGVYYGNLHLLRLIQFETGKKRKKRITDPKTVSKALSFREKAAALDKMVFFLFCPAYFKGLC